MTNADLIALAQKILNPFNNGPTVIGSTSWWRANAMELARGVLEHTTPMQIDQACIEHVELNGHIEVAEQCLDYLRHQAMNEEDLTGKLADFMTALRLVIDQLEWQRRRANWYEVASKTARTKVIEAAVAAEIDELVAWLEVPCPCGKADCDSQYAELAAKIRARLYKPL